MNFRERQIRARSQIKVSRILPFISEEMEIVDVGAGNCGVSKLLSESGYNVQPADITNRSRFKEVEPVIFDGYNLPFPDKAFDVVLLLTVLHHTLQQELLMREAKRVANKIIVMEDIYTNFFQKQLTYFADSIVNLEFKDHPHSNKTDFGWKRCFEKLELELTEQIDHPNFLFFFRQVTYVLNVRKGMN